jgi:hypothetical protein
MKPQFSLSEFMLRRPATDEDQLPVLPCCASCARCISAASGCLPRLSLVGPAKRLSSAFDVVRAECNVRLLIVFNVEQPIARRGPKCLRKLTLSIRLELSQHWTTAHAAHTVHSFPPSFMPDASGAHGSVFRKSHEYAATSIRMTGRKPCNSQLP